MFDDDKNLNKVDLDSLENLDIDAEDKRFDLTEGDQNLFKAIVGGVYDDSFEMVSVIEKSTGEHKAMLIIRSTLNDEDPQEYIFPVGLLFNIHDKDIFDKYILSPCEDYEEDDESETDRLNIVFDNDEEETPKKKPSWWARLCGTA